jgi:hypothetical protein
MYVEGHNGGISRHKYLFYSEMFNFFYYSLKEFRLGLS